MCFTKNFTKLKELFSIISGLIPVIPINRPFPVVPNAPIGQALSVIYLAQSVSNITNMAFPGFIGLPL